VSVGEWLNSALFGGDGTREAPSVSPSIPMSAGYDGTRDPIADIHQRLDAITRQLASVTAPSTPPPPAMHPAASMGPPLNGLDTAIAEIVTRQHQLDGRLAAPPRGYAPPLAPMMPPVMAPAPAAPMPDMSGLERQLHHLTGQIEQLRRSDTVEQAIAGFRRELTDIRQALTDALPRRAIESLEGEVRSLAHRIHETRQVGADAAALAPVEQALGEINTTLRTLTPAENLSGIEETIRGLAGKIDLIVRASQDPMAVQQLEAAIAALRGLVAHVASDETLTRLSDDVHALAARVDQLTQDMARDDGASTMLAALEQRIAQLTTVLETRDKPDYSGLAPLEAAVQALSERIDRLQIDQASPAAFAELETRIGALLARFDESDARLNYLTKVEESLGESMRLLEQRRTDFAAALDQPRAAPMAPEAIGTLRDELAEIRSTQSEAERRTQDSLDIVHTTLGHLVDRLAMIEGDIRDARTPAAPAVRAAPSERIDWTPPSIMGAAPTLDQPRARPAQPMPAPVLPNPVIAAPAPTPPMPPVPTTEDMLAALDGEPLRSSPTAAECDTTPAIMADVDATTDEPVTDAWMPDAAPMPAAEPEMSLAVLPEPEPESLPEPASISAAAAHDADDAPGAAAMPAGPAGRTIALDDEPAFAEPAAAPPKPMAVARAPIDPNLPPDHPLEPGTRIDARPVRSAAERVAVSQAALAELPPVPSDTKLKTNFIATARRAAQLASSGTAPAKPASRAVFLKDAAGPGPAQAGPEHTTFSAKLRSLLVGVSVVVIVLGTLRVAINLFDGNQPGASRPAQESSAVAPPAVGSLQAPGEQPAKDIDTRETAPLPPSVPNVAPAPLNQRSQLTAEPPAVSDSDTTGSVDTPRPVIPPKLSPQASRMPEPSVRPAETAFGDKLPETIGSPALRAAALRGDAGAAYEVGFRYAEGKRVPLSHEEALKWYNRAASNGLVPALFRLGGLYEKGLGVKKDIDAARRYYTQAADRGNAKAMHNLAVLHADGGMKSPDYREAATWFRKAAERGITDSQYNLGILYARGIGLEQNLAEAFKWFSLAAAQGDADAGRKRDDIAKRLDAATLNAATLAIQTFIPEQQPDDAINVAAPPGGWDHVAASKPARNRPGNTRTTAAR
jgi:localization factor PodJL